jgi:hypothetical protein
MVDCEVFIRADCGVNPYLVYFTMETTDLVQPQGFLPRLLRSLKLA